MATSKNDYGQFVVRDAPLARDTVEGGRREANKEDKRERIREAAFELFLEHGVGGTKLADVAERAGVAKGTLFLYASDKEDLVCMVMHERLAVAVERAFRTLPRGVTLLDELVHVFGLLLRTYGEAPDLASAFVRALGTASGPNGRRMAALTYSFLHQLGGRRHREAAAHVSRAAAAGPRPLRRRRQIARWWLTSSRAVSKVRARPARAGRSQRRGSARRCRSRARSAGPS